MSPPESDVRSRPATQDDLTILWDFVAKWVPAFAGKTQEETRR
jgi:hypothetical protein